MKRLLIFTLLTYSFLGLANVPWPLSYRQKILTTDNTTSTITKQHFEVIPRVIHALLIKELQEKKVTVEIKTDWENPYFSVWAHKEEKENQFSINFWGGFMRIPGMNKEALALITCHDFGHLLGGTPTMKNKFFTWFTSEAQSDFYATALCFKKYLTHMNKVQKLSLPKDIPEVAFTLCRTTYHQDEDYLTCLHAAKGIIGFGNLLTHQSWYTKFPSLDTPSREVATETLYDTYPSEQCRIDTLFQGALCPKEDYPCDGKALGARPTCWFRAQ